MINLIIHFDRDSVCMGDDCESHKETFEIDGNILLSLFTKSHILKRLALVSGGKATWVLRLKTNHITYKDIAVIAQQWKASKLLVQDCRLKGLVANNEFVEIHALYRCQEDPNTVFKKLATNRE